MQRCGRGCCLLCGESRLPDAVLARDRGLGDRGRGVSGPSPAVRIDPANRVKARHKEAAPVATLTPSPTQMDAPTEGQNSQIWVGALLCRCGRVARPPRPLGRRLYLGVWDVLGGHVDLGEKPEAALRRELQEELGIQVTQYDLLTRGSVSCGGACSFSGSHVRPSIPSHRPQ